VQAGPTGGITTSGRPASTTPLEPDVELPDDPDVPDVPELPDEPDDVEPVEPDVEPLEVPDELVVPEDDVVPDEDVLPASSLIGSNKSPTCLPPHAAIAPTPLSTKSDNRR
jgi:hypothetical protein